jgi:hypothetical protein
MPDGLLGEEGLAMLVLNPGERHRTCFTYVLIVKAQPNNDPSQHWDTGWSESVPYERKNPVKLLHILFCGN